MRRTHIGGKSNEKNQKPQPKISSPLYINIATVTSIILQIVPAHNFCDRKNMSRMIFSDIGNG